MPTSKPLRVKYAAYKKADDEFVSADLRADRIPSGLDRLKVTYGSLGRRPRAWGPRSSLPTLPSPLPHRTVSCRLGQDTADQDNRSLLPSSSSPLPHRTANCRLGQSTAAQDNTGLLALAI